MVLLLAACFRPGSGLVFTALPGWVAEWSIAHAWKACLPLSVTRVRIPPHPVFLLKEATNCLLRDEELQFDSLAPARLALRVPRLRDLPGPSRGPRVDHHAAISGISFLQSHSVVPLRMQRIIPPHPVFLEEKQHPVILRRHSGMPRRSLESGLPTRQERVTLIPRHELLRRTLPSPHASGNPC